MRRETLAEFMARRIADGAIVEVPSVVEGAAYDTVDDVKTRMVEQLRAQGCTCPRDSIIVPVLNAREVGVEIHHVRSCRWPNPRRTSR